MESRILALSKFFIYRRNQVRLYPKFNYCLNAGHTFQENTSQEVIKRKCKMIPDVSL